MTLQEIVPTPWKVDLKNLLGSWKVAICGNSLVAQWIEEMKRNILSPSPGGRGNFFRSYSTLKILSPPTKFSAMENPEVYTIFHSLCLTLNVKEIEVQ